MKIREFDIKKGIYRFELDEIETEFHSHPAFEIILSKDGGIELETNHYKYSNIALAIIEPNVPHKVKHEKGSLSVLMVECNSMYLQEFLSNFNIQLIEGIFINDQKAHRISIIEDVISALRNSIISIALDERVNKSLDYLNNAPAEYKAIIKDLKSQTHLSDSRLSHLFKEELGISIKKYFVWSKLKRVFEKVISENKSMYEAAIEIGFYDQAHLSKAFKQMLGMRPSDVYNSRMIQI